MPTQKPNPYTEVEGGETSECAKGSGFVFGTLPFFLFLDVRFNSSSSLSRSLGGRSGRFGDASLCRGQDEASVRVACWQGDSSKSAAKDVCKV